MMAEPISHPEDTAANDFSTVLPSQSGEPSSSSIGPACQSVAPSTTKHPTTNHPLIYDNNNPKVNNNNNANNNANNNDNSYGYDNDYDYDNTSNDNDNGVAHAEHNHHQAEGKYMRKHGRKFVRKGGRTARRTATAATTTSTTTLLTASTLKSGARARTAGPANNSKSTSKTLSDNKTSFSLMNVRVLSLSSSSASVRLRLRLRLLLRLRLRSRCGARRVAVGVPSLVRIFKSDRPATAPRSSADSLDNYSLLGSCLRTGDNNNVKSNSSLLSVKPATGTRIKLDNNKRRAVSHGANSNNDNYKSVILLSSTGGRSYFLRVERQAGTLLAMVPDLEHSHDHEDDHCERHDDDEQGPFEQCLVPAQKHVLKTIREHSQINTNRKSAQRWMKERCEDDEPRRRLLHGIVIGVVVPGASSSSSITLIVRSDEVIGQAPRSTTWTVLPAAVTTKRRRGRRRSHIRRTKTRTTTVTAVMLVHATSSVAAQSLPSRAGELQQRACVPLTLDRKPYVKPSRKERDLSITTSYDEDWDDGNYDDDELAVNVDEEEQLVGILVAWVVSGVGSTTTTLPSSGRMFTLLAGPRAFRRRWRSISRTVATITVGALLFQDNVKSNNDDQPLGALIASSSRLGSGIILETDVNAVKSLSKSTLASVRVRCKKPGETGGDRLCDAGIVHVVYHGLAVYIPITTTCKPTMTLTRQSASRTIGVPGSRPVYCENTITGAMITMMRDQIVRDVMTGCVTPCVTSSSSSFVRGRRRVAESEASLQYAYVGGVLVPRHEPLGPRVLVELEDAVNGNLEIQSLQQSQVNETVKENYIECDGGVPRSNLVQFQVDEALKSDGENRSEAIMGSLRRSHVGEELKNDAKIPSKDLRQARQDEELNAIARESDVEALSRSLQRSQIDKQLKNTDDKCTDVAEKEPLRYYEESKNQMEAHESKKSEDRDSESQDVSKSKDQVQTQNLIQLLSKNHHENTQPQNFVSEQSWRYQVVTAARTLIPRCLLETGPRDELKRLLDLLTRFTSCERAIHEYRARWSIPIFVGLAGGGESSLNSSAAANWGSTQTSAPNNNNGNQSGWGGTPGNPSGSGGGPNNWPGNSVNRSVAGNPNQNQGPPGGQNVPGNVSKVNNPSQQSGGQSGPPTSQSSNPSQAGQNNNQWPQGKSGNPGGQNPSVQNNNTNSVQQQQQQQQSSSTGNNNQPNNPTQGSASSANTAASNNPSTKQQLEQLNTMREALFSQDGWGCQHVNQDTNWDVPTSPEPSLTKDGVPMWKPSVNNGTDLWEANLRNGGQPPPQQQTKTPWGHTPATNIGGTWGEDDETADSSNMWTNAQTPSQPNAGQWTAGAAGNQAGMWGGSNWGDPRIDHRDPRELRSVDPREMRGDPREHRMSLDPREHMRVMDPMARDPRMPDMRSDPRGISGRLNGASGDAMWGQPPGPPHHQMGHQHPTGPPTKMLNPSNINQWAAPPPKDIMPGKPSGWEEPSPPTQRRNVPNYDDGTSLWGNPAANQRAMPGNKVSHWKDQPTPNLGRGGMQCPPGMPQNRMPGQPGMKPDVSGPMWGHPGAPGGRNGTWADGPHDTNPWDDPKTPAGWNEAQINPGTWGGPAAHKPKPMGPSGSWGDSDMDPTPSWGHPAKPTLTKEVIWNSREFRYLCDLGFKKEDVEVALRNREMNREEALELLSQLRPLDQWRRHDAHSSYDPTNQATTAPAYPRFNHVAQQMSFPPGAGVPSGTATGGVGGSVASASLLKLQQQQQQQATVPLQQQQPSSNAPQPPFNQASRAPQNQPSAQQLRLLVQQIQLAVQEGYLNHQILNQPLAPQTLILLNQLLQQIKVLQQLHQQHSVQSTIKGNSQSVLQISVQITKTKQQIANLQNQIAVQQATYMKQQQQQQHPAPPSQTSEYYKTSVHDPMSALQNSFTDLTMNKEPPVSQQQSRLNQWKLPSLDKDGDLVTNEFSRAPGTTSKAAAATPAGLTQSHSSANMNPLLGQGDGTWSSRLGESGWPDPGNTDSTDGKDWQPTSSGGAGGAAGAAFTDLVPEFEPGKPWKGTQMKSIEDDPSITPGSVVRSPLSLAAIKDPDAIFSSSSKTSPPPQPTNPDTSIPSLSNSTWTFNPPATTPSAFTSSKNTWGESAPPPTAVTSELWGAPMSKVRGPPPGLGSKGTANTSNGWSGLGTVGRSSSSWGFQSSSNAGWVSTWLLLKNLTPQIDGSTLKTLCMQHGPVQDFRLYLNHGIALTKYSSRDEAIKAQGALNNCVLGNTTIFAESPADSEVHTLLQQLSHGGGGQQQNAATTGAGWSLRPSNKTGPPPDTWGGSSSQLWGAPPSSNSLWSNAGIDSSEQQRATPSSLNSYLPGDLLGELSRQTALHLRSPWNHRR